MLLQVGCVDEEQGSEGVAEDTTAAIILQSGEGVGSSPEDASSIVFRFSESSVAAQDAGVALFAPECLLPATSPAPVLISHPSGVLTIMLRGGTVLQKGHFCRIGKAFLIMQTDGNLVVYDESNRARWASHTAGAGHHAQFQTDGNLSSMMQAIGRCGHRILAATKAIPCTYRQTATW